MVSSPDENNNIKQVYSWSHDLLLTTSSDQSEGVRLTKKTPRELISGGHKANREDFKLVTHKASRDFRIVILRASHYANTPIQMYGKFHLEKTEKKKIR